MLIQFAYSAPNGLALIGKAVAVGPAMAANHSRREPIISAEKMAVYE
jgi:hypothetical protein